MSFSSTESWLVLSARSFKQPLAFATALIDSRWRSAVLLDDRIVGPVELTPDVADTLINAWPPPATWALEGWPTLDGTRIDLTLANLGAEATLSFNGGPSELRALYAAVNEIVVQVMPHTEDQTLDSWLNGGGLAERCPPRPAAAHPAPTAP